MIELELHRVDADPAYIIFKAPGDHLLFFCYEPKEYRQWYSNDVMDPFPLEREDER
jgi:hypothetical protein